jgi:hypothetical protein
MEATQVKFKSLPDTTLGVVRDVSQVAFELAELPIGLILSPFLEERSARRKELRADIVEIRQLLRIASAEGMDKDLASTIEFLARHDKEIQRAVVVWIDLIEILIQNAEHRYGATPGVGQLKAAEVKGVVRYLMRNRTFDIPDVPKFLEPIITDIVVDWSVDITVLLANRYGLWVESGSPAMHRSILTKIKLQLDRGVRMAFGFSLALYTRIRQIFERQVILSADVKAAIDAVEREGLIVSQGQLFKGAADLLVWVSARRRTLMVLVEVVSAAVHQAEVYVSLTGPQKKAYARDLVLAVLDELGFEQRAGLLFAIIDSTINSSIEGSVHLFNKRGLFSHASSV